MASRSVGWSSNLWALTDAFYMNCSSFCIFTSSMHIARSSPQGAQVTLFSWKSQQCRTSTTDIFKDTRMRLAVEREREFEHRTTWWWGPFSTTVLYHCPQESLQCIILKSHIGHHFFVPLPTRIKKWATPKQAYYSVAQQPHLSICFSIVICF